jgi:hypothetical protein
MTSYNTGTTANSGGSQTASQALTIPAGVLAGDVMLLLVQGFTVATTAATLAVASTGTAFIQIGTTQFINNGSISDQGAIYYAVAGASDAGKVITASVSGSATSAFWALALASYTGASNTAPIDVSGGTAVFAASITCPPETTGVSGDWAVYLGGGGCNTGATLTGPSGSTSRQNVVDSAGIGAAINDSNGSVGAAGTGIGGGTFGINFGSGAITAFTVGLAPPGGGGGVAVPAPAQRPALPVKRRAAARLGARGAVAAGVLAASLTVPAVPAPHQPPAIAHRAPHRVLWRGSAPGGAPNAAQQSHVPPRFAQRIPHRAVTGHTAGAAPNTAQQVKIPLKTIFPRTPHRVLWRGGAGAPVASVQGTGAPQPFTPKTVYRRTPHAALWRSGQGQPPGAAQQRHQPVTIFSRAAHRALWRAGTGSPPNAGQQVPVPATVFTRRPHRALWRAITGAPPPVVQGSGLPQPFRPATIFTRARHRTLWRAITGAPAPPGTDHRACVAVTSQAAATVTITSAPNGTVTISSAGCSNT